MRFLLSFAAAMLFGAQATAQLDMRIKTVNHPGFIFVDLANKVVHKKFTKNKAFAKSYERVSHHVSSPYAYMGTGVSAPYVSHNVKQLKAGINNFGWTQPASAHKSIHLTGDLNGKPGAQVFEITLTAKQPTKAVLDMRVTMRLYPHARASYRFKGPGIDKTWTYSKVGYDTQDLLLKLNVSGVMTYRLEATASCIPGPTIDKFNGYSGTFTCYLREDIDGTFKTYGPGCGNAKISAQGNPVRGQKYQVDLAGARPKAPLIVLLGRSKDWFYFFKLPLAMSYMGAPGCALNVNFSWTYPALADSNGKANFPFYVPRSITGVYYAQWIVFDPKANAAGLTLTQGGAISF